MKLRINIKVLCMFRFLAKRPEAARGPGSSGHAAQLKWDWGSLKGVSWNIRNEEQRCPSQAASGATKNQKAWKATIHEQKASTLGNLE